MNKLPIRPTIAQIADTVVDDKFATTASPEIMGTAPKAPIPAKTVETVKPKPAFAKRCKADKTPSNQPSIPLTTLGALWQQARVYGEVNLFTSNMIGRVNYSCTITMMNSDAGSIIVRGSANEPNNIADALQQALTKAMALKGTVI